MAERQREIAESVSMSRTRVRANVLESRRTWHTHKKKKQNGTRSENLNGMSGFFFWENQMKIIFTLRKCSHSFNQVLCNNEECLRKQKHSLDNLINSECCLEYYINSWL